MVLTAEVGTTNGHVPLDSDLLLLNGSSGSGNLNGCGNSNSSSGYDGSPKNDREVKVPKVGKMPDLGSTLSKKSVNDEQKIKHVRRPEYDDAGFDETLPPPVPEESYLSRAGIPDRQMRPPTSKLLIPIMKVDPERHLLNLWEPIARREIVARQVVVHPVKDMDHYKLRNCITCVQREKALEIERATDPHEPSLSEFMVDDLTDGLRRLVSDVRSFHQQQMYVFSFMNLYMNAHFGNFEYINYTLADVQQELRKFAKLLNCHTVTMRAMDMFYTEKQRDGFWRNSGLSSIYENSDMENILSSMQEEVEAKAAKRKARKAKKAEAAAAAAAEMAAAAAVAEAAKKVEDAAKAKAAKDSEPAKNLRVPSVPNPHVHYSRNASDLDDSETSDDCDDYSDTGSDIVVNLGY